MIPTVSIIIPIYNVKTFISRGLKNILGQSYQDFEIILVDDGSTDGSSKLCDEWAKGDGRIRVFHKENCGAGSARNLGIERAKGKYIYFFDIDDLADNDLLEYCVKTMEDSSADMMVFSYRNLDLSIGQGYETVLDDITINDNIELRNIFIDQFVLKMNGFPWNKMYRKSFVDEHHLRFEDLLIQQDEVFNLGAYPFVNKAVISSRVLYSYYIYNKGNTRSRFIANRFDIYKTVHQRIIALKEYWKIDDARFDGYLLRRLWNNTISGFLQNIKSSGCKWSQKDKQDEINRIADDVTIQRAMAYIMPSAGLEQRLYLNAILSKSLSRFLCVNSLFSFLHKCSNLVKRELREKNPS